MEYRKQLKMEYFNLQTDSNAFCVTANTFPDGVLEAHQELQSIVGYNSNRIYLGVSYRNTNGCIIYKAVATKLFPNERNEHKMEHITLKKGTYRCKKVNNFKILFLNSNELSF